MTQCPSWALDRGVHQPEWERSVSLPNRDVWPIFVSAKQHVSSKMIPPAAAAAAAAATDVDALVVVALALEEMTPILCQ